MERIIWIGVLGAVLFCSACGGGAGSEKVSNSTTGTVSGPLATVVDPTATDPEISADYGEHCAAINPAVPSKGRLFLFFPGTAAKPKGYLLIIRAAANNGFHAIGLAYPNTNTEASLCLGTDNQCPGDLREEVLTGQDVSAEIAIPEPDSIENRLTKLLRYLDRQSPSDGWDQFLDSADTILWGAVRVAGHSQGGSTAGYIGTRFATDRAIFFSSPSDMVNGQVAAWVSPGATGAERYYGFSHEQDSIIAWSLIEQNWPALGMADFGTYVNVDDNVYDTAPGFGGSHMLSTNWPAVTNFLPFHNITVVDCATPLDSNQQPVYQKVWQYLCFSD